MFLFVKRIILHSYGIRLKDAGFTFFLKGIIKTWKHVLIHEGIRIFLLLSLVDVLVNCFLQDSWLMLLNLQ